MLSITPRRKVASPSRDLYRATYPVSRLNSNFDWMFNRFLTEATAPFEGWPYPEAKWGLYVEDLDKEYVIHAEAPGFESMDFEIFVNGNVLMLKAEHKVGNGEVKEGCNRCERFLEESVTLPMGIRPEKIEAFYKNGILEVHVPKSEEAKPRRIVVKN